jgi:ribosomal protein S18 acetylase RimI-like enzyme
MGAVEIRPSMPDDLPGILEIEACSFSSPWDASTFLALLSDSESFNLSACEDGRIVGYCFSQSMEKMVHLLNLAVHQDCRRNGLARAMLSARISFAISENKSYCVSRSEKDEQHCAGIIRIHGFFPCFKPGIAIIQRAAKMRP